ncbi:MAG: histidine phosphatase family protein [Pseudomonadota bacterium]
MIVIVRHGNTFESGEIPRRIGARTDLPLTPKGLDQADALGAHFIRHGVHFETVLVSPLLRTRQTAERILAQQPSAPETEIAQFLREIDYGPDENQPEDTVLARIGAPALEAWELRAEAPQGWITAAKERIAAWRELFDRERARHRETARATNATLLVTSNGAARFALMADPALNEAAKELSSLKLPTGGMGTLSCAADGALRLVKWGIRP